MKLISILFLSILILSINSQAPPTQPSSGPGGSDYINSDIIFTDFTSLFSGDGYWLFEPNNPKPDSANLVVFNHGYGVYNPGPYGEWIEHLVKKGNIVIFPKYQLNSLSLPSGYTDNAVTGILDALDELNNNSNRVKPRMENFAIIGHSYGGVITSNIVTNYATLGVPKPQCFMLCQPGTGGFNSGRIDSYAAMDTDYNALILVGEDDAVVGNTFGREIMDSTNIPTSHKNYITHYADTYGSPIIEASHNEPLAANNDYDGGTIDAVITGGYVASKTDAVDFYCYWKLADALLNCTFYGNNCIYAFGDTPEQRNMGQWSDGTDVTVLEVEPSSVMSVTEIESNNFSIYPNPAGSELTVKARAEKLPLKFDILNISGKVIESNLLLQESYIMNLNNLSSGFYLVRFHDEQATTLKFSIQ